MLKAKLEATGIHYAGCPKSAGQEKQPNSGDHCLNTKMQIFT